MAAASPAQSSQSADNAPAQVSTAASAASTNPSTTSTAAVLSSLGTNASKNLRGLNKPKCIKCGNVARSRCPFQSCKSCCAKAQNPCHIHVLKGGSTLPDKLPSSGSPVVDQQSTEASHTGSSHRATSLRQLSTNFAQFNNLQTPVRSRKPLTRKDAQLINEWRFMKLKEYRDGNIAAENEAFDRYMQNVGLLEEVFAVNAEEDGEDSSTEEDTEEALVKRVKLQLRSDPTRIENTRKRMQYIVDQGMRKLRNLESDDNAADLSDLDALGKKKKAKSAEAEWVMSFTDLVDKLNKARNEEDLKACWEMKSQLFNNKHKKENQAGSDDAVASVEQSSKDSEPQTRPLGTSPPKWFSTSTIDDEELCRLNAHFESLEDIEEL